MTRILALGAVLAVSALATVAVIALTPAYGLPVGVATSEGDSMGHESSHVVVFVDVQPSVGDQVVYDAGEHGYVNHRIVGTSGAGYVTQGDAEPVTDQRLGGPYVTEGDVRGVVVLSSPQHVVLDGLVTALGVLLSGLIYLYRRELRRRTAHVRAMCAATIERCGRLRG